MVNRALFILALCMLFCPCSMRASLTVNDSLLAIYCLEVEQAQKYINIRQNRIDSLVQVRNTSAHSAAFLYSANRALAEEYRPYRSQEALQYYRANLRLAKDHKNRYWHDETIIAMAGLLNSIGSSHEALYYITQVDAKLLDRRLRAAYYERLHLLNVGMRNSSSLSDSRVSYLQLAAQYHDSVMFYTTDTAIQYMYMNEARARQDGDADRALMYNRQVLNKLVVDSHGYAEAAYWRSEAYKIMGDEMHRLEWLLRSAIADVRNGVTDNGSSWEVADILYHHGDLEHSYRIVQYSLTNADIFDSATRRGQICPLMIKISNDYQHSQQVNRRQLRIALWCTIFLLIGLCLMVVLNILRTRRIRKQNEEIAALSTELHQANEQLKKSNYALQESNHVKDEYIAHYLNLYSDYLDKLRKFVKDPDFTQSEIERFYSEFDSAFLSIYPNFVEEFNSLLRPEGQIVLKKGEQLNTELRIYALIRLGIDNSVNISRLLRYSVNTIYNYRARLKTLAYDREGFETQIQQIGTFTK